MGVFHKEIILVGNKESSELLALFLAFPQMAETVSPISHALVQGGFDTPPIMT